MVRIGVVAPASRIDAELAEQVRELADELHPGRVALHFHPQCFLSSGHFAGDDDSRARAFLDVANDPQFDALWIARGGYGSCRIASQVMAGLAPAAREKLYLGYSDVGTLLGALYRKGFPRLAHGPMPADLLRENGKLAVTRALHFLVDQNQTTLEPSVDGKTPMAAFNITILAHLFGTGFEPDLSGHVVMLEDVSEHMYRIDRSLWQITRNAAMRNAAGIRLGRVSAVPPNDPDFGLTEVEVVRHWCAVSGIPYLGRADIGHDVDNKIVPFGK
jgi:muramoyltetrapeptide carboxypeptidase